MHIAGISTLMAALQSWGGFSRLGKWVGLKYSLLGSGFFLSSCQPPPLWGRAFLWKIPPPPCRSGFARLPLGKAPAPGLKGGKFFPCFGCFWGWGKIRVNPPGGGQPAQVGEFSACPPLRCPPGSVKTSLAGMYRGTELRPAQPVAYLPSRLPSG